MNTRSNQPSYDVTQAVSRINTVTKDSRIKRLSNERILQIVTMLYAYTKIVSSPGVMDKTKELLQRLKDRMKKNLHYYPTDSLPYKNIEFLTLILDNWYALI